MRPSLLALCAALTLAACTAGSPKPDGSKPAAAVECLGLDRIVSRRPSGPRSILFETIGGRVYRNDLPGLCPGLARAGPAHIVEIEAAAAEVCRNDRIRVYDPAEVRGIGVRAVPQCRLGSFTPVAAAAGRN